MRIIRRNMFKSMPWKNGGGVTHEIARSDDSENFAWRLSVAEVSTSGSFSLFPQHNRILTVISGAGMVLVGQKQSYDATLFVPIAFPGTEALDGRLIAGPCQDFNLIYDPARISGEVRLWRGAGQIRAENGTTGLYLAAGTSEGIDAGDFAFLDSAHDVLQLSGEAVALVVRLDEA